MRSYENLIVWQQADDFAHQVYRVTRQFPKEEIYGLTSQLRRAAISIPTNLAEGSGRQNRNETRQFVNIAFGSFSEVGYLINFSYKEGLMSADEHESLLALADRLGALLWKFYKSF